MTLIKKVGTWLLSLTLILLCLVAAKWQYDKGLLKSEKNREISRNSSLKAVTNPKMVSFDRDQWRSFRLDGEFQENYQLLKNQYQDGEYGFHVLQKFKSNSLGFITVDRGWVKAGPNAKTPPNVPKITSGQDQIEVRLRADSLQKDINGTLFASPSKTKNKTEFVYFDLISGKINQPITLNELPSLSTGPHFAYAFQWTFFAALILFATFYFSRKSDSKTY